MMGPRSLLSIDAGALAVALVGAGALAAPIVAVFVLGMLAGAVFALAAAWHSLSAPVRGLVRGYIAGRLELVRSRVHHGR